MGKERVGQPAVSAGKGSVWAAPPPSERLPSLAGLAFAVAATMAMTWLVATVLIALSFLTGVLTSEGMSRAEFYDRAGLWLELIVLPILVAVFVAALRGFAVWFANYRVSWTEAGAAAAVTAAAVLAAERSSLGIGFVVLAAALLIAALLRWRAGSSPR